MKTYLLQLMAFCTGHSKHFLLLIVAAWLLGACATIKPIDPVKTVSLQFKAEKEINSDKKLPIDIVYITYVQELRELNRYSPEIWFEGNKRSEWKQKESLSISGGEKQTIELNPRILERTVLLVVIADYQNQNDASKQQIVVDYAGKEHEVILVRDSFIEPTNKSLQYIK